MFSPLHPNLGRIVRLCTVTTALLLSACASRLEPQAPANPDWEQHHAALAALSSWALAGRLNIRQQNQSDTVQINWDQQAQGFDLRLSGSFGLGAVHVYDSPAGVTVDKAGEDSVTLPSLAALSQEYFGYDFPTAHLQYWVRGIPAPGTPAQTTLDPNQLLGTLSQNDATGQHWTLNYDRYQQSGGLFLPGRIRVQREGLLLTFLINRWQIPVDLTRTP
jgi:outer membrane lipoprotein LolB